MSGRAWYRAVQIQEFVPRSFPSVPYLSAIASRTGQTKLYAMLTNKHLRLTLRVNVEVQGFAPREAVHWTLIGERIDATNEQNPHSVSVVRRTAGKVGRKFEIELPPHSLSALEIEA